jgi:threonine/homoserine/homoserine lactone efflux protein
MHVDLGPFLLVSVLVIVTPGPDTAVITKHVLFGGRRGGIFASLGVVTGLSVWTLAAPIGVAALLRASEPAFLALKIAGALYLAWLGLQMLRGHAREAGEEGPAVARRAYRQGLLSNLGNPKIAVFFTGFLPQFVHAGSRGFVSLLVLGEVFCALGLTWLVIYSTVVGRGAGLLRRPRVRRAFDRLTGVVLVGFGIRLATESR